MKYIKYIKSLLMTVLIMAQAALLSSCIYDDVNSKIDCEENSTYLNLVFGTKSGSMPSPADNGETGIASLRVFVYNSAGQLEHTQVYTPATDGKIENPIIKVAVGVKNIYVIANEKAFGVNSNDLSTKLTALSILGSTNSAALEAVLVKYADFPSLSTNGLLMTGKALGQNIPEGKTRQNPEKVIVEVVRNCARLDLKMQKSVNSASGTVVLKKVEFFNGNNLQTLFETTGATSNPAGAAYSLTNAAYDEATGITIANSATSSSDNYQDIRTFYLTENLGSYTDDSHADAEYMVLTYTINGTEKTSTININDIASAANRYNVVRNTCYVMSITVDFEITINLDILDWNDVPVQGDILGSRLNVSKSKVVMDWWNLGRRFDTNVDFEADDEVTFEGYYVDGVKVTALPSWLAITAPSFPAKNGTFTMTYSITAGESITVNDITYEGYHPNVVIRLKSENITKDIKVIYDNGYLPSNLLTAAGWTAEALPERGIHISKRSCTHPDYDVDGDFFTNSYWSGITYPWIHNYPAAEAAFLANAEGGSTNGELYGKGPENTANWVANNGGIMEPATYVRQNLGNDWYLPSLYEADAVLYYNNYLGSSYLLNKDKTISNQESTIITSTTSLSSSYLCFTYAGMPYSSPHFVYTRMSPSVNQYMQTRGITNIENLSLTTTKLVADWWNWGKNFSTTVSFTSYNGNVSVKSVDNSGVSKNWLTAATILSQSTANGVTIGAVHITYAPTAGNNGTHDNVAITLENTGGSQKVLTVIYDNGLIPASMLNADWTINRPKVGLHVSKTGNIIPDKTAANADITMKWAEVATSVPAAKNGNYGAGVANTSAIINALNSNATTANACTALGDTWFLASEKEQKDVFNNENLLGPSYTYKAVNGLYATSTEVPLNNSYIWAINHHDNTSAQRTKVNNVSYVRAVCNVGDLSGASIISDCDEVYLYAGAGEYEVATASYLGNIPTGTTNTISITSGGSEVSLTGINTLPATSGAIKLKYANNSDITTIIELKIGDQTKNITVHRSNGLDVHANHLTFAADFSGVTWTSNSLSDFSMVNNNDGTYTINTGENVTPIRWEKDGVASVESDNGAEPIFEPKKMVGNVTRTSPASVTKYIVVQAPPMYCGWFGGNTTSASGGRRYSKRLILECIEETSSLVWRTVKPSVDLGVNDLETGKENTQRLSNASYPGALADAGPNYEAAYFCYMKNDLNGNGIIDNGETINWYLPAQNQLAGVAVTRNAQSSIYVTTSLLWSSTEWTTILKTPGSAGANEFHTGYTVYLDMNDRGTWARVSVRCVRDL